jgi:hypothetical protein
MVTDAEIPDTAGEARDEENETVSSSLATIGASPDRVRPVDAPPADLDAIVAGPLTVLDHVEPEELYLPDLAPSDQERVDDFLRRGRGAAQRRRCSRTGPTETCSSPGAASVATGRCRRRQRRWPHFSELAETGFTPAADQHTKTGKLRQSRAPKGTVRQNAPGENGGLLTLALDLRPTLNSLSVLRTPSACSRMCVRLPAEGQAIGGKPRLHFGWCGCSDNTSRGNLGKSNQEHILRRGTCRRSLRAAAFPCRGCQSGNLVRLSRSS